MFPKIKLKNDAFFVDRSFKYLNILICEDVQSFRVHIDEKNPKAIIYIGIFEKSEFSESKLVGKTKNSYSLNSSGVFLNNEKKLKTNSTLEFSKGDTIRCRIDYTEGKLSFSRNTTRGFVDSIDFSTEGGLEYYFTVSLHRSRSTFLKDTEITIQRIKSTETSILGDELQNLNRKEGEVFRLIHISDFHIGENEQTNRRAQHLCERLVEKYGKDLSAGICLTGDIYHGAFDMKRPLLHHRPLAKKIFEDSKLLETFQERLFCCPGNHDSARIRMDNIGLQKKDNFFYPKSFPNCRILKRKNTTLYFIGIDTSKKISRWSRGKLGNYQLGYLSKFFKNEDSEEEEEEEEEINSSSSSSEEEEEEEEENIFFWRNNQVDEPNTEVDHHHKKVIIYLHHHPFSIYKKHILKDREKFLRIIEGKCNVLLFGHEHSHKRFHEEEKKLNMDVIIASGKSPRNAKYDVIIFKEDGKIEVEEETWNFFDEED